MNNILKQGVLSTRSSDWQVINSKVGPVKLEHDTLSLIIHVATSIMIHVYVRQHKHA
jgi:hypothetical protein